MVDDENTNHTHDDLTVAYLAGGANALEKAFTPRPDVIEALLEELIDATYGCDPNNTTLEDLEWQGERDAKFKAVLEKAYYHRGVR